MRHLLLLLIDMIQTPPTAAANHGKKLAYIVDESDRNLPVSRGSVDAGSTEQIHPMFKDDDSVSAPIPMTNRFTCEPEGKK